MQYIFCLYSIMVFNITDVRFNSNYSQTIIGKTDSGFVIPISI
jgi:hypothetical protein